MAEEAVAVAEADDTPDPAPDEEATTALAPDALVALETPALAPPVVAEVAVAFKQELSAPC